jgi:hypothetical protein
LVAEGKTKGFIKTKSLGRMGGFKEWAGRFMSDLWRIYGADLWRIYGGRIYGGFMAQGGSMSL